MLVRYERDDDGRRVAVTLLGAFQASDVLAVIERQRTEGTWIYGALYDLRGLSGPPTTADLRQLMSQAGERRPDEPRRGPVALLVTDPIVYGAACMYAALGGAKLTIDVFRDWDDADHWLTAHTARAER